MRGPRETRAAARRGGTCAGRTRARILLKDEAMTKRLRQPATRPPDRHALYEVAVQGVDWDLDFLERVWRYRHPGRAPRRFREDFCSTAALATAWVLRGRD